MKNRKVIGMVALLGALSLVATACGNDDGGETGGGGGTATGAPVEKIDVTVYGQGAWTGPYNYLVVPSFQAAQMAGE
jgi:ABC-type glycerol-3-phosphate transport system substrate-binding protein